MKRYHVCHRREDLHIYIGKARDDLHIHMYK